jgi:protein ImuB
MMQVVEAMFKSAHVHDRMVMSFACIHIPDFMVQSVLRAEPALRSSAVVSCGGALASRGSALALISGKPPLWSVVAASAAALQAGVQLGMTKSQVTEFCGVEIRHRSEAQEKAAHAALLDVGWSISPHVEDTAADTIVLGLEGLVSLFGADENIARELAQRASRVGVIPHIAVASNIEAAVLAARGFQGVTILAAGEESARLGSLSIRTLVTDVEVLETLERWGVDCLRALAALPVLQLSERLGQEGVRLHQLAQGTRVRSLVLAEAGLRFEEEMELEDSVEELEPLSFLLGRLLDQLCARLEGRALAVRTVRMRFELEPSFEKDVQTLKDDSRKKTAPKEYTKVLTLPVAMRDSKVLLKLVRLSLQADPPKSPIQKIVMAADAAPPRVSQNGLFTPKGPDPEKLELTIARLAKLVGESNVGVAELLDTHRAENFQMARWAGNTNSPLKKTITDRKKGAALADDGDPWESRKLAAGFRVLRPAVTASVEIEEERPVRICFSGMQGEVVAASGPWRSSGEWWQEDGWDQEEWDLAICFGVSGGLGEKGVSPWPQYGVYRIYYNAPRRNWFVRGFYD